MNFRLCSNGFCLDMALIDHVETQMRRALRRFDHRIAEVNVLVTAVEGTCGGDFIECQIEARLASRGSLVVRATRQDPFAAVKRAAERAERRVEKHVQRVQRLQACA